MLTMRRVTKATELKRFKELEGKYHYRTFPIGGMLAIVVMAMMSGANSVKAIARFAKRLTMAQRRALCMPHAKNAAGVVAKHEYKVPSYVTLYNFLRTLDLIDFGEKLSGWMASQGDGTLPRQLALDGKFIKEVMGVVSVVNAETGAPVAVAACSRKEGEKGRCEMPVGRKLLGRMDLSNALVSSDALHCQQDTYPPPQAPRRGWLQGVRGRSSARAASI